MRLHLKSIVMQPPPKKKKILTNTNLNARIGSRSSLPPSPKNPPLQRHRVTGSEVAPRAEPREQDIGFKTL